MADKLSVGRRSWNMSRIKSRDTNPELSVRRSLHRLGYRYRLHRNNLPGKPDIVLPKHRIAIFVHGCFWHQHSGCIDCSKPKTNAKYWGPKLLANVQRDRFQSDAFISGALAKNSRISDSIRSSANA